MKRIALSIVAVTLVASALPANADSDKLIVDLAAQTANSLAYVTCEFEEDSATSAASGPAVCIDKSGVFLSLAFNSSMRAAKVKKCELTRPGMGARPMSAELLSIDRQTGMAFVKCTDSGAPTWSPVTFADKSNLAAGTQLVSVSLMPGDAGHAVYFGRATVATVRYEPQALGYVTGGKLTCLGSPIFSAPGKAIGLVWRQSPEIVELTIGRQRSIARIRQVRESAFFSPVEEFGHVLKDRGKQKLAWSGILALTPADQDILQTSKPGIRVSKIIPGGPADKAKLKELDVIVQVNGQDLPPMPNPEMLVANLEMTLGRMAVGEKVTFKLANGKQITITLEEMPLGPTEVPRYADGRIGILLRDKAAIDPHISLNEALKADGVIVVNVAEKSPAVKGDLQRADVITSIDAQPVRTIVTARELLRSILADGKEKTIAVVVQRKDTTKTLTIKLPKK